MKQSSSNLDIIHAKNEADSSQDHPQYITDVESIAESMKTIPKGQILPYLTKSKSNIQNLYDKLTQETVDLRKPVIVPIIPRIKPTHQDSFISLQKWEGIVLEVKKGYFLARLIDLTHEGPDEEAELPMEEVTEQDKALVKPGAIFYWNIGYLDMRSGQRIRASVIRFRRLPKWSREEIEAAKREAAHLQETLGWKENWNLPHHETK